MSTCRCNATADSNNKVIRKVSAATRTISTVVSADKLAAPSLHVLAGPDGNIYFTDFTGHHLYQYNAASGNLANITLGGGNSQLLGMAINPFDQLQKLLVLENNERGVGVIYSVGVSGPFSSYPPTVSTSPDLPLTALWSAAFYNGNSRIWLGSFDSSLYTYNFSGSPVPWNTGSSPAASGAMAGMVAYNSALSVAYDVSSGNMLLGDAVGCRVWLVQFGRLRLVAGVKGSTSCGATLVPDKPDQTQLNFATSAVFGPDGTYAVIADRNNNRVLKVLLSCSLESPRSSPSPGESSSPFRNTWQL
jgi:hypothetical protein